MSKGSCIAIGIVAFVCAVGFAIIANQPMFSDPAGPTMFYGLAGFCGILATACFLKNSKSLTLRLLGALVCAAYIWALIEFLVRPIDSAQVLKAAAGFIAFALPGAYVTITGRYPWWGYHSKLFRLTNSNYRRPQSEE
jgi:hypothetical protein